MKQLTDEQEFELFNNILKAEAVLSSMGNMIAANQDYDAGSMVDIALDYVRKCDQIVTEIGNH
jgi:hypothetical protein